MFDDPEHSVDEERFLILGITEHENLCIVSHCYRGEDNIIRIISARKATTNETNTYQPVSYRLCKTEETIAAFLELMDI